MAQANPTTLAKAQMREAMQAQERNQNGVDVWPRDQFGNPMLMYSRSAAEVVRTADYENATVGPATITGFIVDGPDDQVLAQMRRLDRLVEHDVGEDRQTLWNETQARAAAGQPIQSRPARTLG